MKLHLMFLFLALSIAAPLFAWPSCSGNWVHVPKGTTGPGIVVEHGQTFQCQQATATSSANSTSNAKSTSNANSNAKATGGNASVGPITNTSTAQGGNATASNNSSGNSTSISEDVRIPHMTASAITPDMLPTSPCFKSYGGAAQSGFFGASFGGGKIDKGCDDRETARVFARMGNLTAAGRILCDTPAAKRAKLTQEECMAFVREPEIIPTAPPTAPTPIVVTPQITVEPAAVTVIAPPETPAAPVTTAAPPTKKHTARKVLPCPPCPNEKGKV
jgi:hypothetical protein